MSSLPSLLRPFSSSLKDPNPELVALEANNGSLEAEPVSYKAQVSPLEEEKKGREGTGAFVERVDGGEVRSKLFPLLTSSQL